MRVPPRALALALLAAGTTQSFSQPTITGVALSGQPQTPFDSYHPYATNSVTPNATFSASPGANVFLTAVATGTPPLHYQWQFNYADLLGQTNRTLVFTNLQMTNRGDYTVVVTNSAGSASRIATLAVDGTFTKITTGPIVTNGGYCAGGTWGDYNNDGFPDLFVFNAQDGVALHPSQYLNNGDGSFLNITSGPTVNASVESFSACWGDYDNDGHLDLFVSTTTTNLLFHNNGDGTFTQIFDSPVVHMSNVGTWGDYDNDGLVDLFLSGFDTNGLTEAHNFIFRNNGDGTFSPVTNVVTTELGSFWGGAWADYDNDGNLDLFVASAAPLLPNRLYHNNGDGTFTRVTTGDLYTDLAGNAQGCAWGDYDNDGLLDLFVANFAAEGNVLYHNDGNGAFNRVMGAPTGGGLGKSASCAWGDYDNDGFLDLFVTSGAGPGEATIYTNLLYHNNGDGTFSQMTLGSPVNEYSTSFGCSWVDYDNDGFLDLFASLQDKRGAYLYQNNGNSNGWLVVKLVGTASNRAAVGAKVRVNAFYAGASRWQLRQITGGSGFCGHNELQAHFGLGDATNVDVVRIEWPSGIVQTLTNVAPKQLLTVVEHQQIDPPPSRPRFTSVSRTADGAVNLSADGQANLLYVFETSINLVNWNWLAVRSNATGSVRFTDSKATNYARRFYRVSIP